MELSNFTKNTQIYGDIKTQLNSAPYNLTLSEDTDQNIYMINYNKLNSDLTNKLVKECRGVLLEKDTNKVLCYTFDRKDHN